MNAESIIEIFLLEFFFLFLQRYRHMLKNIQTLSASPLNQNISLCSVCVILFWQC